ncbi:hypothetical protein M9Y10_045197 [Tritrichomonas musculus]|uniref:Small GTP-binding protein n=1 Tax=Tritrichomonas musculus TaxID=1915356 RepID=A0ABR2JUK7_9EUKA
MPPLEFKVVMIGAVAVGKSAIANRLQFQIFEEDYQPTIGAGYIPYRTTFEGKEIELQIWDTAGMERYKSLGSIYYRDAKAAIIVYDQTSLESADALQSWLTSFRATVKTPCYICIAGNKDDLPNKIVPQEKIKAWCDENGFDFFITSAKAGTGVNEMFQKLIESVVRMSEKIEIHESPKLEANESSKGGCC